MPIAKLTQTVPGDFDDLFDQAFFGMDDFISRSSSTLVLENEFFFNGQTRFEGSGFVFEAADEGPSAGTLTSIELLADGVVLMSVEDLDIDAAAFTSGVNLLLGSDDFTEIDALFEPYAIDFTGSSNGEIEVGGTDFDDTFRITSGDSYIQSTKGNDTYIGGPNYDQITFDTFDPSQGISINLTVGTGTDEFGDTDSFENIDAIRGSSLNDFVVADDSGIVFRGLEGNDDFTGGEGFDQLRYDRDERYGGADGVIVNMQAGVATDGFGDTDTFRDVEMIGGSQFADSLFGTSEFAVELQGRDGDDQLWGYYNGTDGNPGEGDDLFGGNGSDLIVSTGGSGFLYGGDDQDFLVTAYGENIIQAGDGFDWIYVQYGSNEIDLGTGDFKLVLSLDLFDPAASDFIAWSDDVIDGTSSETEDYIYSGRGNDTINAGAGNDWIDAGGWNDIITGGAGFDRFIFSDNSGFDTVRDFTKDEDFLDFTTNSFVSGLDDLTVTQLGNNTVVSWAEGTAGVTLEGFGDALLTDSDLLVL